MPPLSRTLGEQLLHTLEQGEVCGRINFIDGRPHTAHAVAATSVTAYVLNRHAAEAVMVERRHIAVMFLIYFWKTLTRHIRDSNELMKTLIARDSLDGGRPVDAKRRAETEQLIIESNKRIAQLKRSGLTARDMDVLAHRAKEYYLVPLPGHLGTCNAAHREAALLWP